MVELRFFGGLSVEETAGVMGISSATVKRAWSSARAFLHREISGAALHAAVNGSSSANMDESNDAGTMGPDPSDL